MRWLLITSLVVGLLGCAPTAEQAAEKAERDRIEALRIENNLQSVKMRMDYFREQGRL